MTQETPSSSPSRPVVIAGNWKMYKTIPEAEAFVETLTPLLKNSQATVYLATPFTAISATVKKVKALDAPITIGAQNMNDASEGAFTGEIAARMLKDAGASFVILGHSERRQIFRESDAFINRKIKRALMDGLQPILCIGETAEERERGEREEVLQRQIGGSLEGIQPDQIGKVIVAYEPVWAIGTGKVATAEEAQTAHAFCRKVFTDVWGEPLATHLVIQYGGSVKAENAAELLAQPDIDGLLVGGASLSPHSFSQIINAYQR